MKVTVVLTCWRRFDNLIEIIEAWLAQPEVGEVILWDNSQDDAPMPAETRWKIDEMAKAKRIWWIKSSFNYGSSARYALASLAKHEVLLFGDDDVMPHPGLTADLLAHYDSGRMVGIKGRLFNGAYHGNTEVRGEVMVSDGQTQPIEVDMLIGHIMLTHRDWLTPYNFSDAAWYCCELELQGRIKQDIREGKRGGPFTLWVVPSDKHHDLPAQTDENALYRRPGADAEKIKVYERLFAGRCLRDRT